MEISARGSIQVRGLGSVSAPLFADAVAALGIELCETVPVLVDPLPGDPAAVLDPQPIAASLRRAIAEAVLVLAPKVSCHRRQRADRSRCCRADIRLHAIATSKARTAVALAGDAATAMPVGVIAPQDAEDAVRSARGNRRGQRRAPPISALREAAAPPVLSQPRAEAIGLHLLRGGMRAGWRLPRSHADALKERAEIP
jgi:hypothetical protein